MQQREGKGEGPSAGKAADETVAVGTSNVI